MKTIAPRAGGEIEVYCCKIYTSFIHHTWKTTSYLKTGNNTWKLHIVKFRPITKNQQRDSAYKSRMNIKLNI